MKKILTGIIIIMAIILAAQADAFINKSPLEQHIDNLSHRKAKRIEHLLAENEIECSSITKSGRKGLSSYIDAYDIKDTNGNVYLLLLNSDTKDLCAVLTIHNELLFGEIESDMGLGDISEIPVFSPENQ